MGERPGMNQVGRACGQLGVGRPPETAHTCTRRRLAGRRRGITGVRSLAWSESTSSKNRGAAAWTPTKAGLLSPEKLPTQTAST